MNSNPVRNSYTIHYSRYQEGEWVPFEITDITIATARKYYDALYVTNDLELRAGNTRPYKDIRMSIDRDTLCDI